MHQVKPRNRRQSTTRRLRSHAPRGIYRGSVFYLTTKPASPPHQTSPPSPPSSELKATHSAFSITARSPPTSKRTPNLAVHRPPPNPRLLHFRRQPQIFAKRLPCQNLADRNRQIPPPTQNRNNPTPPRHRRGGKIRIRRHPGQSSKTFDSQRFLATPPVQINRIYSCRKRTKTRNRFVPTSPDQKDSKLARVPPHTHTPREEPAT